MNYCLQLSFIVRKPRRILDFDSEDMPNCCINLNKIRLQASSSTSIQPIPKVPICPLPENDENNVIFGKTFGFLTKNKCFIGCYFVV